MDCGHQLILDKAQGNCAMEFESVIGQGHIEMLNEEEKYEALKVLMKQYRREDFSVQWKSDSNDSSIPPQSRIHDRKKKDEEEQ